MRKSDINFALTLVLPRVQQQEVKRLASGGAFTSEEREARGEGEDGPGGKGLEGYVKKHSRRFWCFCVLSSSQSSSASQFHYLAGFR